MKRLPSLAVHQNSSAPHKVPSHSLRHGRKNSFLRQWTGPLTEDLVLHPGDFGLGRVPARLKPDTTTRSVCGFCSTGCALDIHLEIFFEQVVVQLIGRRKLRAIELLQPRKRILGVLFSFADRLQALVAPAIVPAPVAHRRSAGRALFHLIVPFRFKEIVERLAGFFVFSKNQSRDDEDEEEKE